MVIVFSAMHMICGHSSGGDCVLCDAHEMMLIVFSVMHMIHGHRSGGDCVFSVMRMIS